MDLESLLSMGAGLIEGNSDEATSGLDLGSIAGALGGLLGGESGDDGIDLGSIVGKLTGGEGSSELLDTVSSWIGNGENKAIDPAQVGELIGDDKISEFADKLGINLDSAKQALADALPQIVDKATPEGDSNILGELLSSVGGAEGAMGMVGKLFG